MKEGMSFFGFDPVIGCPFDDSEMKQVEEWRGFKVGAQVDILTREHSTLRGEILTIGENGKFFDGKPFVAFAVKTNEGIKFRTHQEILHAL
ncbi:MAG: hypothetical protein WC791_01015 [Candidatus Paceibacterota bacterium]|jgi:hypothetical protein